MHKYKYLFKMHKYLLICRQSNEVKGNYHMEKEGLRCCLSFLTGQDLNVEVLVTDRQKQINKWLRQLHSNIKHYYDIWHVAKGIYKWCMCIV